MSDDRQLDDEILADDFAHFLTRGTQHAVDETIGQLHDSLVPGESTLRHAHGQTWEITRLPIPENRGEAMSETRTPPPKPLAMATVYTPDGNVVVPCEPVGEWLAITPGFFMDEDGNSRLTGMFTVTHVPSGRAISEGEGCIECARYSAQALAGLDVDWSVLGSAVLGSTTSKRRRLPRRSPFISNLSPPHHVTKEHRRRDRLAGHMGTLARAVAAVECRTHQEPAAPCRLAA